MIVARPFLLPVLPREVRDHHREVQVPAHQAEAPHQDLRPAFPAPDHPPVFLRALARVQDLLREFPAHQARLRDQIPDLRQEYLGVIKNV